MVVLQKFVLQLKKLKSEIDKRVEAFGGQYLLFGVFGLINYPLYYFIWKYLSLQSYENLWLRLTATLLCIPLAFKDYWPRKLRTWLPVYWYFTLLFCLPFFFTFMLLENGATEVWLMSTTIVLVWLVLLIDWLSFFILFTTGILLAWLAYKITPVNTPIRKIDYLGLAAQYLGSLAVMIIFARNKQALEKEKLRTMQSLGSSIAHELRTPIRTISLIANRIKGYMPVLKETCEVAEKHQLPIPLSPAHSAAILRACNNIEMETQESFTVINMLLMNVNQTINTKDFNICSINTCVEEAIRRYPFDLEEDKLIHWQARSEADFTFTGQQLLVVHILFNLLKNAFYQIKAAGKGEIHLWTEQDKKNNRLHFRDTAKGIAAKVLPRIFDRFYTASQHGTGIGLTFCKLVMQSLGGDITCRSVENEYAEFILIFPKTDHNVRGLVKTH